MPKRKRSILALIFSPLVWLWNLIRKKIGIKNEAEKRIAEHEATLRQNPRRITAILRIAEALEEEGDENEALIKRLQAAKRYEEEGKYREAVAQLRLVLHADDKQTEIYQRIADLHLKLGLNAEAKAELKRLAKLFGTRGDSGDRLKLIACLKQILGIDPKDDESHRQLGDAYCQIDQPENAWPEYRYAAVLFHQNGHLGEFQTVAERYLSLHHHDPYIAGCLAQTYLSYGDAYKALHHLKVGHTDDPKHPDIIAALEAASVCEKFQTEERQKVFEMLCTSYAAVNDVAKLKIAQEKLRQILEEM